MSIISFDRTNARHRYRSPQRCRVLVVQLLSSVRNYYRSPAIVIDRPPLLSIARHYYRLPAIIIDCPLTKFDRPPQNSSAVQRQSSQQLINNDNRDWVGESVAG